jgi:hypothetical protein
MRRFDALLAKATLAKATASHASEEDSIQF